MTLQKFLPHSMGAVFGCCCPPRADDSNGYEQDRTQFRPAASSQPNTPLDDEARRMAAERAEQRQKKFETSAVGRAAYKSEKEAKAPARTGGDNSTAKDWLS